MASSPPGDVQILEIRRDDDAMADFFSVITSYFPRLVDVDALRAYCRASGFGPPTLFLANWRDRPAAVHAIFPFPLWIHGCATVGGKPEFGSLHPTVAHEFPRPDIFGMMIDAIVASARQRSLPVLVAWPSQLSLKSHRKKGFRELAMPHTTAIWLLRQAPGDSLRQIRQAPGVLRKAKALAGVTLKALYTAYLRATTMGPRLNIHEIPADSLENYRDIIEANDWPPDRVTVWRNVDFIRSRIREGSGIKVLAVSRDGAVTAIVFAQLMDDSLYVYDVLPPTEYGQIALWRGLLQFGRSLNARILSARLYDNNPAHTAALAVVRRRLPGLLQQGVLRFAVLALDPAQTSVYDANSWYGTDMLGMGF